MKWRLNMDIKNFTVDRKKSIKQTMHKIDRNGLGIAFILNDDESLFGVVTDGDIRRAILQGHSIEEKIEKITNKNPVILSNTIKEGQIPQLLEEIELFGGSHELPQMKIPLVDDNRKITDILFVLKDKRKFIYESICKETETPQIERKTLKKILVIGGAGYLGSLLSRKLLNQGFKVKVLDKLIYGDHGIKDLYSDPSFELIQGDIRSIESVVNSIADVEAVIHLAALVGDPVSSINPQKTLEINYHSTRMIAEICKYHQINRFIFASTCSVYGKSESIDTPLTENAELKPVSLYAQTKIESENALLNSIDDNFAPTIFRLATLYGLSPRMRFDLVVNLLTAKAYFENNFLIFGGSQYRPILHLEDACDAFIRCLKAPIDTIKGKIFNVGSNNQNYKIIEIGNLINEFFPKSKMEIKTSNVDERNYFVDFAKIKNVIDFKPKRNIQYCLTELKNEFIKGSFNDYLKSKYSNYKSLQSNDFKLTEEMILQQD